MAGADLPVRGLTTIRRLPCDALPVAGGTVQLEAEATRHARVLRLEAGADVLLFDGRGGEADGTLVRMSRDGALVETGPRRECSVTGPTVVLCLGLPKGGKVETVVRATTELGVRAIHLVHMARSVARPPAGRAARRTERLEKVALEAARQSGRTMSPRIHAPATLTDVAKRAPTDAARAVCMPTAHLGLTEALPSSAVSAWIWVGPEGGLDPSEEAALIGNGWVPMSFGEGVLRAETAAIVSVALALSRLGALAPPAR